MRKIILFTVLITTFNSCNSDDSDVTYKDWDLEEAEGLFLEFNNIFGSLSQGGANFNYLYKDGKVVKKTGGINEMGSLSFSKEIIDEVVYKDNQITVKTKRENITEQDENEYNTQTNVYFMQNNKILKSVNSDRRNDTILYHYTGDYITKQSFVNGQYGINVQKDFYYNSIGNLDSIITRWADINFETNKFEVIDESTPKKFIEIFDQYDNYVNPTKKLRIFPELFKRSLSKNNFARVRVYEYLSGTEERYQTSEIVFPMIYVDTKIQFKLIN